MKSCSNLNRFGINYAVSDIILTKLLTRENFEPKRKNLVPTKYPSSSSSYYYYYYYYYYHYYYYYQYYFSKVDFCITFYNYKKPINVTYKKKFLTHKTPTKKFLQTTKCPLEKPLNSRSTHEKKFRTHELPAGKYFRPKKYPRQKNTGPTKYPKGLQNLAHSLVTTLSFFFSYKNHSDVEKHLPLYCFFCSV